MFEDMAETQRRSTGVRAKECSEAWEVAVGFQRLWDVLYPGNADIVWEWPDSFRKVMGVDCEGGHGVRLYRVRSQGGDNVPVWK